VFCLLEAPRLGLAHPAIIGALLGALVILLVFVYVETRSPDPMLPLDLFRSPTFSGANLLTLLLYAALGGTLYFLPFDLIQVHHYRPAEAGGALLPFIVLMSLLSGRAGKLVDRYGARKPLMIGPVIAAAGLGLLALPGTGGSYWKTFFPGATVLGLGMAITVAPLTTTVMAAAGPERAGLASGVNNAVSRTASLLAIAVFGIVAYARFSQSLARRLDALGIPPDVGRLLAEERGRLAAARAPSSLPPAVQAKIQDAIAGAFVDSFRLVMLLAAGLAVAAAGMAWWMIEREPRGGEGTGRPAG
jgi:MFS family permease